MKAALRIARYDLRDLARQRGTWLSLLMFPIVNVVLITVLPGVLSQREQQRSETATYRVAIEGTAADVEAFGGLLASARVDLVESDDAEREVRNRDAEVGLAIGEGAADALRDGRRASVRVVTLGTRGSSRAAAGRVVNAIEVQASALADARVTAAGLPVAAAVPFDPQFVDVADTERGARLDLSGVVPAIMLLPLSGAVGLAGQRVSGGKDQRVLEPLLLLPVSRSTLLAGKAVSGYVLGAVTLPAVVLPLLRGRMVPIGASGRDISIDAMTVLAVFGVATLVLAFLVALGACAGAASRSSSEMASLLPFMTFPLLIIAIALPFLDVEANLGWAIVPVLGPLLLARDLVAGTVSLGPALATTAVTPLWAAALVVGASRFLERERSIVRATT